jgi:cold-inducible RNA-binding protein
LKLDARERRENLRREKRNMTSKLYVGNLPFATTAHELQDLFTDAGAVSAVDLIFDKFTGRSRGFAFVNMASPEDAQRVIEKFHGFDMGGRALTVNEARPREERPARSFEGSGERRDFAGGGRSSPRNERSFR